MIRRFQLVRHVDVSGVSGTGMVAEGVVFFDGSAILKWFGAVPSITIYPSISDLIKIHGHGGATQLEWIDA